LTEFFSIFTDACLCNLTSGIGSSAAYIVWFIDTSGNVCPDSWHTNKIEKLAQSSTAPEALNLQGGHERKYYYRQMIYRSKDIQSRNTIVSTIEA
jgi:hypothetical protein